MREFELKKFGGGGSGALCPTCKVPFVSHNPNYASPDASVRGFAEYCSNCGRIYVRKTRGVTPDLLSGFVGCSTDSRN